jgi:protein gp37
MSAQTEIEWCDRTFNGWIGCTKVSRACDRCYAEINTAARALKVKWGPGAKRYRTAKANWKHPEHWNKQVFWECKDCGFRGTPKDFDKKHRTCASTQYTVTRQRVFSMSLGDWLDNEVPIEWLVDFLDLVRRTPNLDWLLLTKRIGNWRKRLELALDYAKRHPDGSFEHPLVEWLGEWLGGMAIAPRNVWIGATVVNQAEADRDVPKLLRVPARIRFLSVEPMLAAVDLSQWLGVLSICKSCEAEHDGHVPGACPSCGVDSLITTWGEWQAQRLRTGERYDNNGPCDDEDGPQIQWVIAGGESGQRARPSHPDWYRSLRDQCAAAGVPFLFKQWGEWMAADADECIGLPNSRLLYEDGVAYEHGFQRGVQLYGRVGKKNAGRLLDGVEHNGFPEVRHAA